MLYHKFLCFASFPLMQWHELEAEHSWTPGLFQLHRTWYSLNFHTKFFFASQPQSTRLHGITFSIGCINFKRLAKKFPFSITTFQGTFNSPLFGNLHKAWAVTCQRRETNSQELLDTATGKATKEHMSCQIVWQNTEIPMNFQCIADGAVQPTPVKTFDFILSSSLFSVNALTPEE